MGSLIVMMDSPRRHHNVWGEIEFFSGNEDDRSLYVYNDIPNRNVWADLSGYIFIQATGWRDLYSKYGRARITYRPKLFIEKEADAVVIQQLMRANQWAPTYHASLDRVLDFGAKHENPSDIVIASMADGAP